MLKTSREKGKRVPMLKQRKTQWLLGGIAVLVVVGGIIVSVASSKKRAETAETPTVQTAVARRGDLIVYASAAGEVIPSNEMAIGFDENGTLIEITVNEGDEVQAGQVLARLRTNYAEESIQASIADAEVNLLKAQQKLDALNENWKMDMAQAQIDMENAQAELDRILNSDTALKLAWEKVVNAKKAVADAERAYNITLSTASQADIDAAHAQVILLEQALERAKEKFEPYASKPDSNLTKARLQAELSAAQEKYDAAVRNYNAMLGTSSDLDQEVAKAHLETAQAQLEDAMREWERVKDGASEGDVALAEARLELATERWRKLKDGVDPTELALAQKELASAQARYELAKQMKVEAELLSPIDGTVLEIDADLGDYVNNSPVMTIGDLQHPLLRVYLDETDLDKVAVGYEAEVTFDAIPDEVFKGVVVAVKPSLVTVSNVKTIEAIVKLDVDSFAKPMNLPAGLSASVDVIGGRAENAVLVPVEAIREIGPDEYAVFVMEDGAPKLRLVEVGLMDFTSAEIVSGLKAGEVVTTGIVETGK